MTHGQTAPPPLSDENVDAYRRRLLRPFLRYSPAFKAVDPYSVTDAAVFDGIEAKVYAGAALAAKSPTNNVGVLRPCVTRSAAGHTVTEFYGSPSVWMSCFAGSGKAVKAFNLRGHELAP